MQIVQSGRHDVVRRIEQMNAAILEFLDLVGIENVVPGIDLGVGTQNLLHILDVVADAGRAPHVVDGVLIAGIVERELLGDLRPDVSEIRQLGFIQFLENPGLDLAGEKIGARHDDVIAGLAGQQFCLQRIVGIEGVVANGDAGRLGEFVEYGGILVIRPIVIVDDALRRQRRPRDQKGGKAECENNPARIHHVSVGSPAAFQANMPPARWLP